MNQKRSHQSYNIFKGSIQRYPTLQSRQEHFTSLCSLKNVYYLFYFFIGVVNILYSCKIIISIPAYIFPTGGHRTRLSMTGLGALFLRGPVRIGNSRRTIELLRRLAGFLALFSFTVKFVINFRINFVHEFRKTQRCVPGFHPWPSAWEAIGQTTAKLQRTTTNSLEIEATRNGPKSTQ